MQLIKHEFNINYVEELKVAIRDLAKLINSKRPQLKLFSDSEQNKRTFDLYDSYPEQQKQRILDDAVKYRNIVSTILDTDPKVSNQSSLWVALKLFGIPNSLDNIFSYIEESDVIEIYRYDGIQVFRNLNFHDVCSYELPELFVYTWEQLYYRKENITEKIAIGAQTLFSGKHDGLYELGECGEHAICETFSPKQYKLKMSFKYLYPLRNKQNQVDYLIALSNVAIDQLYFNYQDINKDSTPATT